MKENNERLFSLDVLRGLDMLLLTVIGPIITAANKVWGFSPSFMNQFTHNWGGFTLWDIIMPLFIFMCGAAVPLALHKRLDANGRPTAAFWKHICARVVLLWLLGMLAQGMILSFDPLKVHPYCNTLHSIAVGYFFTALVMLIPSKAIQFLIGPALLLAYGFILHFCGDYSMQGNAAMRFEHVFYRPLLPAGHRVFDPHSNYTWVLTSLQFVAMTLAGYYSTLILRSAKLSQWRKALILFGYAFASLGLALALFPVVPCIKHIFTSSCVLWAVGWSVLALAILYVITDIWKFRKGMWLILLFGQMALTAYMMHVPPLASGLHALANAFGQGGARIFGAAAQPLVLAVVEAVTMIVFMIMYRRFKRAK